MPEAERGGRGSTTRALLPRPMVSAHQGLGEIEPSGRTRGYRRHCPRRTPGPGSGCGRPDRIRSRATAFCVGFGSSRSTCQHHRSDRGDDQQGGSEFEGEQILGENEMREGIDVLSTAIRASELDRLGLTDRASDREGNEQRKGQTDQCSCQTLPLRVSTMELTSHVLPASTRTEQDHDRAGVTMICTKTDERPLLYQVNHAETHHRGDK